MTLLTRIDALLGRVTMYRLITIALAVTIAVYTLFTATGVITGLSTTGNLVSLAVVVVASVASNRLIALALRVAPHDESAVITALLLYMIFVPLPTTPDGITWANQAWFAGAGALAMLSKYVIAWRGRHLLNPAAAGSVLVVLAQWALGREQTINPLWQTAATQSLLPFVALGALAIVWRTRKVGIGVVFAVLATVLVVVSLVAGTGSGVGDALRVALYSFPIVFIAGYMLTEPLTLPPRRWQQMTVAVVVAVLVALPTLAVLLEVTLPTVGPVAMSPELALLIGNVVAFALAPRTGIRLEVRGSRPLGGDVHEVTFVPRRPVRFEAGQYLELHVPHRSDRRGPRRVFSISSPPHADELTVALRVPERSSSLKQRLLATAEGARVAATGVHGDFVWPRPGARPLLVAGGIGVTPFLSQLRSHDVGDAILVYGVPDGDDVPYRDELVDTGVDVVLVSPDRPADLPEGWRHVSAPLLSADVVTSAVPDAADRVAMVSGPPAMVDAVRRHLRPHVRSVRTDHFTGY
ncbi:hypothetical protein GCM10009821_29050 [Aeromicrobium halocynthiae]|uniref:FAD-binding FR-type domain-containing protein n=1 Tax=Aeromicrobium halocynthiae TaxID=560557 RepID=A0ABN2W8Q0_9ACTN